MSGVLKLIENKVCAKCGESKPVTSFMVTKRDGTHPKCRDCYNEIGRQRNKINPRKKDKIAVSEANKKYLEKVRANPEKHAKLLANKKKYNSSIGYYDKYFMKRFGITYAQVRAMYDSQFGKCANRACGKEIVFYHENKDWKAHPSRACVDHNHSTGAVRALLCMPCNTILGTLETKENIIIGLMEYRLKHNHNEKD